MCIKFLNEIHFETIEM